MDGDYAFALALQRELNDVNDTQVKDSCGITLNDNHVNSSDSANRYSYVSWDDSLSDEYQVGYKSVSDDKAIMNVNKKDKPMSVIDPAWEMLDPTPNIHALFLEFDRSYFYRKLAGIEVKWSPKMTRCAGLCTYEGYGGLCSVRLSLPLLKLRPRKDLIETLLHEMIHAYLFVTQNNKDHEAHGPEFHKHMKRLREESGANVTVYHTFHDEVSNYQQHWWRCTGSCRSRKPFFGYVKRAMNRAPSDKDMWWKDHQHSCGGVFEKVKEPEGYSEKKAKKEKSVQDSKAPDIRSFFNNNIANSKEDPRLSTSVKSEVLPFSGHGHVLGLKKDCVSSSLNSLPSQSSSYYSKMSSSGSSSVKTPVAVDVKHEKENASLKESDKIISSMFTSEMDDLFESEAEQLLNESRGEATLVPESARNKQNLMPKLNERKPMKNKSVRPDDEGADEASEGIVILRKKKSATAQSSVNKSGQSSGLPVTVYVDENGTILRARQNFASVSSVHHHKMKNRKFVNNTVYTPTPRGRKRASKSDMGDTKRPEDLRAKKKIRRDFQADEVASTSSVNDNSDVILIDEDSNFSVEEKYPCPVCGIPVEKSLVNQHLDQCLNAGLIL